MSIKVTLDLPNGVVEHAQQVSQSMHRSLEDVLRDSLEPFGRLLIRHWSEKCTKM